MVVEKEGHCLTMRVQEETAKAYNIRIQDVTTVQPMSILWNFNPCCRVQRIRFPCTHTTTSLTHHRTKNRQKESGTSLPSLSIHPIAGTIDPDPNERKRERGRSSSSPSSLKTLHSGHCLCSHVIIEADIFISSTSSNK